MKRKISVIGIIWIIFFLAMGLKLAHVIIWSWWLITSPLWLVVFFGLAFPKITEVKESEYEKILEKWKKEKES